MAPNWGSNSPLPGGSTVGIGWMIRPTVPAAHFVITGDPLPLIAFRGLGIAYAAQQYELCHRAMRAHLIGPSSQLG